MPYTVPVETDFKTRFDRDFLYSADDSDLAGVRTLDITRALTQTGFNFNPALWSSQTEYTEAYLLASAHWLCRNILASSQGLGGTGTWLTNSKAVESTSETFTIPERIARSPFLAIFSRTSYGMQYLQMLLPRLIGNVQTACGATTP